MTFDPTQNRATLSPEAVAQLVADREAGTPGPWQFQIETDQDGYDEVVYVTDDIVTIHWSNLGFGADEYDTRVDDAIKANASRIARLPDLEAAYLTLAAENATLRDRCDIQLNVMADTGDEFDRYEAKAEAELATLRASEAAALERVKVLTEALEEILSIDSYESRETFDGSNKHVVITKFGEFGQIAHAALTPTADKEPKT